MNLNTVVALVLVTLIVLVAHADAVVNVPNVVGNVAPPSIDCITTNDSPPLVLI
jgi:hypothetical protein